MDEPAQVAVGVGNASPVPTAPSERPALQRTGEILTSSIFLGLVLLALTWPIASILPRTGPDASWQAGLYMALEGGLQFGRDFVFTYGPLGFLHAPVLYGEGLFLVAFAYSLLVRAAVAVSLLWAARRALPLPLAAAACYVALVVGHLNSALVLVAFLWAFASLEEKPPGFTVPLLVLGGGILGAVELLGKVNYGISILALCFFALCALPGRRRNLPSFGGVAVVSLIGLWVLTGQSIGNLPDYLSNAIEVVSGYSRSMGIDIETKPGEVAIAVAATSVLLAATAIASRREGRIKQFASCGLLLLFAYLCFKQDFIRRGPEGRADFSVMMMCAAIAVAARLPSVIKLRSAQSVKATAVLRPALGAILIAPMVAFVIWSSPAPSFLETLKAQVHVSELQENIESLSDAGSRSGVRATSRASLRGGYAVPANALRRIGDRTVAIEPWEIGVAWAYELNWKPLPVIQDYAAYTPALDRLNASALSGNGPEMILRQDVRRTEASVVTSVDDRYPAWDAPGAKLALICNYREVLTASDWQLLEKSSPRCGPIRSLGSVQAQTDEPISVPSSTGPREIVFARIHGLDDDLTENAEALLYRSPNRWVSFDGARRWNMAGATAGDGLVLRAPRQVDYRRPFQLAPDAHRFSVGIDGSGPRGIEVSFYSREVER